jgi:hemin uptake protein HemP
LQNGIDKVVENRYHLAMDIECTRPSATQASGTPSQSMRMRPERVSSRQLLGERGVLIIEHQGREYRLQLTQNYKLILTA